MADAPIARICECGNKFETTRQSKKFCSKDCKRKNSKVSFEAVCEGCGITFRPKRTTNKRFCSRDCAFEKQKNVGQLYPNFEKKKKEEVLPHSVVSFQHCIDCRKLFSSKRKLKRCGPCASSAIYYMPKPRLMRPCLGGCGTQVTGTEGKKWCVRCSRKRGRDNFKVKHGSVKKHRHRARRYGVPYEPINPIKLFERDQWRCQICGCKTPQRLRGTNNAKAPELDHRIPMSKGGGHTWANCQCSCRSCNGLKGNSNIIGQLPLFIQ